MAQLVVFGHAGGFSKEFVSPSFIKFPPIESIVVVVFLSYLVFAHIYSLYPSAALYFSGR
jgi:hypothetical protein